MITAAYGRLAFGLCAARVGSELKYVSDYPGKLALALDPTRIDFAMQLFERDVKAWQAAKVTELRIMETMCNITTRHCTRCNFVWNALQFVPFHVRVFERDHARVVR